ncbi:hypothetical protein LOK49_LG06G03066 [Camellia lanceoleosa]|uniref:Uncharacterized protein n=1 Tax=Camellia lanceoleosa TaxID=1840588 RepID=A0ACC0HCI4_9ERIC|nr:hypothetical protein LOK49_LG06G03066 [Camellia lanceoleosa]
MDINTCEDGSRMKPPPTMEIKADEDGHGFCRVRRRRRRREVLDFASILGVRRISQPKMGFITEILRRRYSEKTVGIGLIVACLAGGFVGSRLGPAKG